jgi:rhamnogalacturonyl hydrolase YesR
VIISSVKYQIHTNMIKLNYILLLLLVTLVLDGNLYGQVHKEISNREIILRAFEKGQENMDISTYPGTLLLHGMSEFALLKGNDDQLNQIVHALAKFGSGDIKAAGNFISYEAGGSGAAYLSWKGATNKLDKQVAIAAEKMMSQQKRTPDGLMTVKSMSHHMFIDVTFAVTPYLLYSGLKFNKPEYVDYAVFQTLESFRILKDEKTGLIHQGRGFQGEGKISEDNWSRGNGWGAFALAILVRDLPESHPKRSEVVTLAKQFFAAVIKYQDKKGLWHQEMTDPTSYFETSGSGILLYSLGIMLEEGLLNIKYQRNLEKGLSAYLDYIGPDGSVSNTCIGCLCPDNGTKKDYKNRKWELNDYHAFGPVVLAFTQAAKMGITNIKPLNKQGYYVPEDSALIPGAYVRPARGVDVSWENDRIGYRVYGGPTIRDKVRSGVDIWAKSVDYPMLDNFYKLSAEGKDYHTDYGKGCDFYHMGKLLGCGGLAVWIDGKPYSSESYDSFTIIKNQPDKIEFELEYNTWNVPDLKIEEHKKVEMEMGTNLFKVTSTLKSDKNQDIIVAVGLTTFGKQEVFQDKKHGIISVWEKMDTINGYLGTAILVNPETFTGFAYYNGDEFIMIKVKTNVPFSYYSGAGWEKSKFFKTKADWQNYIKTESKTVKF